MSAMINSLTERQGVVVQVKTSDNRKVIDLVMGACLEYFTRIKGECENGMLNLGDLSMRQLSALRSGWKACIRQPSDDATGLIAPLLKLNQYAIYECSLVLDHPDFGTVMYPLSTADNVAVARQTVAILSRAIELSAFEQLQPRLFRGIANVSNHEQVRDLLDRIKEIVEALHMRHRQTKDAVTTNDPTHTGQVATLDAVNRRRDLAEILYFYHFVIRRRVQLKLKLKPARGARQRDRRRKNRQQPLPEQQQQQQQQQPQPQQSKPELAQVTAIPSAQACFVPVDQKLPLATRESFATYWISSWG